MEVALRPNDQKPAIAMPAARSRAAVIPNQTESYHIIPIAANPKLDHIEQPFVESTAPTGPTALTPAIMIPERDTTPMNLRMMPHRPIAGPAKLTIQSTPVKSQPPMLSSNLSSRTDNAVQSRAAAPVTRSAMRSSASTNQLRSNNEPVQTSNEPAGRGASRATGAAPVGATREVEEETHQGGIPGGENNDTSSPVTLPATAGDNDNVKTTKWPQVTANGKKWPQMAENSRKWQKMTANHSSSDENRSSGHASMSDTGHGSSSPGCGNNHHRGNAAKLGTTGFWNASEHIARKTAQDVRKHSLGTRCNESRSRHKVPWNGTGLEDVKLAIQQLTMRSQTSTSTYSSLSAGSESSEPVRRLGRYSSLETVNTNVTSADE